MDSVRSFLFVWACFAAAIVLYAVVDLDMNPWLAAEGSLTFQPDFARIGDLAHWGGRLLSADALPLLVGNALVLGGLFAISAQAVARAIVRPLRRRSDPPAPAEDGPVATADDSARASIG